MHVSTLCHILSLVALGASAPSPSGPGAKRGVIFGQAPPADIVDQLNSDAKRTVNFDQAPPADIIDQLNTKTKRQEPVLPDVQEPDSGDQGLDDEAKALLAARLQKKSSSDDWTAEELAALIDTTQKKRHYNGALGKRVAWEDVPAQVKRDILEDTEAARKSHEDVKRGLLPRDHRKDCGPTGQGTWVPVDEWSDRYAEYCSEATGPYATVQVSEDGAEEGQGWITMVSNTTLTDQKNGGLDNSPAGAGHIWWYARNDHRAPTGYMTWEECTDWEQKQANRDSNCYGPKHADTRGGTWIVDSWGIIGGKIYKGYGY